MKQLFTNIAKVNILPYLLLSAVVFLSYHQLLQMYFWRDDYTGLYFAMLGNLSANPVFAYPYHIALLLEKYAWQLFGLNAAYYFLTVIIFYNTSSWLLFYFLQRLFQDKKIAFLCTLVFAAGYIGQDGMKMTMGDGLGTILALNALLFSLVAFIKYLQGSQKIWLICTFMLFFLTLEIAPQRTASSIFIFLALDWVLSWKKRRLSLLLRSIAFIMIFLVQFFLHPSAWFLGYRITRATDFSGLLVNFSPWYLIKPLGIFWNLITPSDLQENLNRAIGIEKEQLTLYKFWLAGIPSVALAVIIFIYLKLIRRKLFSFFKLAVMLFLIIIFSFIWVVIVYQNKIDTNDMASLLNGGILLFFIIIWISWGGAKLKSLSILSLLTVFGVTAIFFLTIPERILVSYNRYLLFPAFAPALLPIIFITREYYQKKPARRRLAQLLFLAVIFLLVSLRLMMALSTQQVFIQNYSRHAKKLYQDLYHFVPNIDKKTIIYLEGTSKELNLSIGDAARVGYLGSEAAIAVHYQTEKENIILPQTLGEIPRLLKENPDISRDNVYTFIYDEDGLRETSQVTRRLLLGKGEQMTVLPAIEEESLILTPSVRIWTLLPIEVRFLLKVSPASREKDIQILWEYNTAGLVHQDKFVNIKVLADGEWHEYKFTIPASGEYLQKIYFNRPQDDVPEISDIQLNYLRND